VTVRVYIDGVAVEAERATLPVADRSIHYGDGLFETMYAEHGRVRFLDAHLERLHHGCDRIGLPAPQRDELEQSLVAAVGATPQAAVLKLIVTRGSGPRGYRPPAKPSIRRVLTVHEAPTASPGVPIDVRWCATPLARNPLLAGIKHLNRLEQVLAQAEWSDPAIAEGLMLDTEGEVVCGTHSNLFAVTAGTLFTPDLRFAGVAGVMRRQVLAAARAQRIPVVEAPMHPDEVERASELFVTNAISGIRPVGRLDDHVWPVGPVTTQLARALALW
jgi:4-amino-4-deoxychorismate lyase